LPVVDSAAGRGQGTIWALWLAAAIAFVGGLLPLVFGGTSSRISGVVVPFTIGAVGLAATALMKNQSRTLVAVVYFVSGLAIVFGLLSMFALPVRLAALGSCPVAPNPCTTGLPRALSDGENNGMGSAAAFGIIAVMVGFFGLATFYRRAAQRTFVPLERKIPPMPPAKPVAESVPEVAAAAQAPSPEPAPDEEPELPAPEELPELPAHESSTSTS
jgi:hypothetical protein